MLRQTRVENGEIRGLPAGDPCITSYKGVPFAAPPVGALRWKAPQPAKNWNGVFNAYEFAPISVQPVPGEAVNIYKKEWNVDLEIPMSEDCLYLNIWTPASAPNEKLPVFVWYFGGGYREGNTREREFNGENIARRGIVVVTVNYRVNHFGFLAHPELTAEAPDAPTNFGLLDQKAGLEWVKRNIAAFGGDPANITIGGQSAGGGAVSCHLVSPQTEGLFQRAIMMSSLFVGFKGAMGMSPRTLAQAEKDGEDFFQFAGLANLAEVRKADAFYLRDKFQEYGEKKGVMWAPVIDEKYLFGDSIELLLANKRKMVPVMAGHTTDEFMSSPQFKSREEFEAFARTAYGDAAGELIRLCGASDPAEINRKANFRQNELGARAVFDATAKVPNAPDSWYYVFDGDVPGPDRPGTFHSVDLWFWFESLMYGWRPFKGESYDLARKMCTYMSNFIKSGNPNGPDSDGSPLPEWKPYAQGRQSLVFRGNGAVMGAIGESELISFLLKNM
jgi:para-nitrobenzyl esterase